MNIFEWLAKMPEWALTDWVWLTLGALAVGCVGAVILAALGVLK